MENPDGCHMLGAPVLIFYAMTGARLISPASSIPRFVVGGACVG